MAKEKTEVTPPVEEATEVVTPPETETQENLQAQLDAAKAEAEQNLELYKDGQRKESKIAERERKQDVLDTIPALRQEMADNREYMETMATFMEQNLGASAYTEQPTVPRSPFAELRQRQEDRRKQPAETKKETVSQVDPEDLKASVQAQGIMDEMGWGKDHPTVKKVWNEEDPQKVLKAFREAQKTQRDTEVEERYQQKLKDGGITTPETAGPSGQGTRSYTPAQIAAMSYEEYASNKESIEKAYRAGNIK